ncbi:MAG: hypothetical protein P8K09_02560 [Hyphomicrobiales bacterium]|jgi:hypothetical protein|nr:hypothetical protein [Hyphomicrobiales bacterium]
MALFEIYKRIGKSGKQDGNILIVRDNLSILAFIFPPLWLIINKNFFLIPVYFLTIYFFFFLSNLLGETTLIFSIIFFHLFLAIQSNILREWILNFKNYQLDIIVRAENKMSAYNIYNKYIQDKDIVSSESEKYMYLSENIKKDDEAILNIF